VQKHVYIKGVKENVGHATIVFDKFHVVSQVVVIAFRRTDYGE
jgi:transposase